MPPPLFIADGEQEGLIGAVAPAHVKIPSALTYFHTCLSDETNAINKYRASRGQESQSGRLVDLRRDISAFEQSFKALLKTLRDFQEANDTATATTDAHEGGLDSTDEQTHQLRRSNNFASQTPIPTQVTDDEEPEQLNWQQQVSEDQLALYRSHRLRDFRGDRDVMFGGSDSVVSPHMTYTKAPLAIKIKLDGIWLKMHSDNEEEATEYILDHLEQSDDGHVRQSRSQRHSVHSSKKSITGLRNTYFSSGLPVLHPHSTSKIFWDAIGISLVAIDLITIPLVQAWNLQLFGGILALISTSMCYWVADIAVTFNLDYYLNDTMVDNRTEIFWNYCRRWLFVDLMLVSIDVLTMALLDAGGLQIGSRRRFVRLFRLLLLLRILKMTNYSRIIQTALIAKGNFVVIAMFAILEVVVINLYSAHILACAWFHIGHWSAEAGHSSWLIDADILRANLLRQYVFSINWVFAQVTPAPIQFHAQNTLERCYTIGVILFSLLTLGGSLARLRSTLHSFGRQFAESEEKKKQLDQYLRLCQAPLELKARILRSAEWRLRKSTETIAEPPAGLLPKTLKDELLAVIRKPALVQHPLFSLLDQISSHTENVIVRICSEALNFFAFDCTQDVFIEGRIAQWMLFMNTGTYEFHVRHGNVPNRCDPLAEPVSFRGSRWFAEACLFAKHIHSTTLSTTSISEGFTLSRDDLILCIESSPLVVVSVCQYAREFLRGISKFIVGRIVPDYLPQHLSDNAYEHVQKEILQVLNASKMHSEQSDWGKERQIILEVVGSRNSTAVALIEDLCQNGNDMEGPLLVSGFIPPQIDDRIRLAFPELGDNGVFDTLEHSNEASCIVAAISSAVWLITGHYDAFVQSQHPNDRLSHHQWSQLQDFLQWVNMDSELAHAIFVFLLLRGLVKSWKFRKLCAPKYRATYERMLHHCLNDDGFQKILPSVGTLDVSQSVLIRGICDMCERLNLGQFLQGETAPSTLQRLERTLKGENAGVFRAYLFSQLCVLCGLSGSTSTEGSAFFTSKAAVPFLIAVRLMKDLAETGAPQIYDLYLKERLQHVGLTAGGSEALAIARLICLTRIVERDDLRTLLYAWQHLSLDDKVLLTCHFRSDGIVEFAVDLVFLPLYLANAQKNTFVGMSRALRILIDVLTLLYSRGLDCGDSCVCTVDIYKLANFTERVCSSWSFENCRERIRVIKVAGKLLLTVDEQQDAVDLRGRVMQIQRTLNRIVDSSEKHIPTQSPSSAPSQHRGKHKKSKGEHVLISARFDGGEKEMLARSLHAELKEQGVNSYMVQTTGAGDSFGEQTTMGLDNMFAMVAVCYEDYGVKTNSAYCSYAEVRFCIDRGIPIVPVKMCKRWPPPAFNSDGSVNKEGRSQNRFAFRSDVIYLDWSAKPWNVQACAGEVAAALAAFE